MNEAAERGNTAHMVAFSVETAIKAGAPTGTAIALTLELERRRWWKRRGYTFPDEERTDRDVHQIP